MRSHPRLMRFVRSAGAALAVVVLVVCSCNVRDLFQNDDEISLYATVRNFAGLDGCGWVLQADEQMTYEPTNLDPLVHQEGLRVWVKLRHRRDLYSFCMVGPMVDVIAIRPIR
ncbi:hypothetical protein JXA88_18885 [Candidatus Fermentibacteria bacterium]|nr:hypothetical protein [Candidatus Fermentibacteria bacterium]